MAFKFVIVLAFVTVASAGYIQPQQQFYHQSAPAEHTVALAPSSHQVVGKKVEEYDPHPQYKYSYDVQDSITGDSKSQSETRNGDAVEGEYSLIDADGYKRTVHYTADAEHGFNAVVTRVPLNEIHHGTSNHVVKAAPNAYSAPTVVKTPVEPVAYASPIHYNAAPIHYAAQAPSAVYAAPSHYKSTPVVQSGSHAVRTVSPAAYSSPPYYIESASHTVPTVLKNASPVLYSSPPYSSSAPAGYAAPLPYGSVHETHSAPAYAKSPSHSHA